MRGPVVIACLIVLIFFVYVRNEAQKHRNTNPAPETSLAASRMDASLEQARANTSSKSMTFNECLRQIRAVSQQLAVAPVNIVETTDLRTVRFPTPDDPKYRGVLITCSRPDEKMVIAKQAR